VSSRLPVDIDFAKHTAYGGLDLAATRDLTAFVLVWPIEDLVYVHPWFWLPEDGLEDRCRRDNVRYDVWRDEGLLELTPGPVTDWRYVTARILQLAGKYQIAEVGFDRYGARDVVGELMDAGVSVVDVPQGAITFNAPCRRLEELVLSRRLRHNGHKILRWNIDCCSVKSDANLNLRPVKPDRLKSSKRIDGVVALLMALWRSMTAEDQTISYSGLRSVG
jgi:phage terminase large subunit-like protein